MSVYPIVNSQFNETSRIETGLFRYELWKQNTISQTEVEVYHVRHYQPAEIELLLKQHGLKVIDLSENPHASMTLWLPLQLKEVILDGYVEKLTIDEKKRYRQSLPRERQLRFIVNSSRTKKPQMSANMLKIEYDQLMNKFHGEEIPMSDFYCGFYFIPKTVCFYTKASNGFSEIDYEAKLV